MPAIFLSSGGLRLRHRPGDLCRRRLPDRGVALPPSEGQPFLGLVWTFIDFSRSIAVANASSARSTGKVPDSSADTSMRPVAERLDRPAELLVEAIGAGELDLLGHDPVHRHRHAARRQHADLDDPAAGAGAFDAVRQGRDRARRLDRHVGAALVAR